KVGAVQEGVLRRSFLRNGEDLDQALWTILDGDWRAQRAFYGARVRGRKKLPPEGGSHVSTGAVSSRPRPFFALWYGLLVNLRAVFPPMPTPFKDGEIDEAAIGTNVRHWMTTGLGGIVALGTNGEASLLDDDEADRVLAAVRAAVPAGRTLIAGVGRESPRARVAAARRAAAAGADAVLVRTPSFYRAHVPVPSL